ncbi:Lar family restriction alleviation protein [Citrobacter portucalensis]|uniref:hypothetical protein n=1 Tax=Citrobacter portucalensis TaxID=1639133 RepID=UPI003B26D284
MADAVKVIDGAIAEFSAEPVEFLPDNLDRALTILGVALPISKEEFNLDAERWMQRLINRVIRLESELTPPAPVVPDEIKHRIGGLDWGWEGEFNRGWNACRSAMLQAEPVSNSDELPLDYLQGHKDGLEWAAQLAEANHPQTCDWLYDDPIELARAIRKGPDMPEFKSVSVDEDDNFYSWFGRFWYENYQKNNYTTSAKQMLGTMAEFAYRAGRESAALAGNSPATPDDWVMVPKEMTPEMMRAVQIKSELGGYGASELSGAYDMFAEFWDIAVSAAPQQEVKP